MHYIYIYTSWYSHTIQAPENTSFWEVLLDFSVSVTVFLLASLSEYSTKNLKTLVEYLSFLGQARLRYLYETFFIWKLLLGTFASSEMIFLHPGPSKQLHQTMLPAVCAGVLDVRPGTGGHCPWMSWTSETYIPHTHICIYIYIYIYVDGMKNMHII